ncbi:MAG TPA: EamA family transporter [Clostridiales bacterium]|nr:EamA family transporter [Clostridiales bacterium]
MNSQVKSAILLFIAPLLWGVAFVMQCIVDTTEIGTLTFNAGRFLLGAVALLPVIAIFEKEPYNEQKLKKTVIYGAITGVILFVASEFQMYGISLNKSSGKSGFLTGLYIVIVPFLNLFVYKRRVSVNEWIAAIVALIGLFLLSVSDGFGDINIGDAMVFVGAFFWAIHILAIDKFVESVSPIKYSFVQYVTCALLNAVCAVFTENISMRGIYMNIIPILYTGILSIGMGYTFQILGQRGVSPNFASIILATEGVFAAISGAIILGEKMTAGGYLGCVLMFLGTVLSQIKLKKFIGKNA